MIKTLSGRRIQWIVFGFLLLFWIQSSAAQWSSDPAQNLAVADTTGRQELPKIAATADGGCYISWFDTRTGAYRVYMQRLNAFGVKQWDPQGLLISSNPQSTSLVDYDLAVDDSNNAIVVFTDTRNGSSINPFAYKISPQGDFRWGLNGVQLSDSFSIYQANPRVCVTSDGSAVIAWIHSSTPNRVAMQKLSRTGAKQWGNVPLYLSGIGSENLTYPSVVPSDNGSVILMWSGYSGSFLNPQNYKLYSQKFSSAGAPLWTPNPDTVYNLGRVSGFFVPKIFPDGNNGAFYVWHDERGGANSTSYVQRFTSAGTHVFPANGSASSTLGGRLHNDAWVAYTPANGETYMFWYETDAAFQSSYGVYGQKFSTSGARQWPDSGIAFRPFGGGQPGFIRCFAKDSAAVVYYFDLIGSTSRRVKGFKVDRNGNMLWGGSIIDVSSASSDKGRLSGVLTQNGNSILTWADNRQDDNGIYAQELNFNGALGVITDVKEIGGGIPDRILLQQNYPNPFNPTTTIAFTLPSLGTISTKGREGVGSNVSLKVYDLLGREVATLVDELLSSGDYERTFSAEALSTGIYFYRLTVGNATEVKKMMVVK